MRPAPPAGGYASVGDRPGERAGDGLRLLEGPHAYPDVDVAVVAESTYPYLRGGVSAVVHDIIVGNPDLTFGIIHISWDVDSASTDLYGMPANVAWVRPVLLSMRAHRHDFSSVRPSALRMSSRRRLELSHRLFDALGSLVYGDREPLWALYDEGMNPRTRRYPLWALLGSREFMLVATERLSELRLPLTDLFWLLREFFSLACAVLGGDLPRARVYHAHTTGYASLLAAAAARQNDGAFLLTEHNLYVRDTINVLLDRSMALSVTARDWKGPDRAAVDRAWMAWWIEMGRFCYPSATLISYLYPRAILEASDLGAPVENSVVIANGMPVRPFDALHAARLAARRDIQAEPDRVWRLVYIARLVPIKGLIDLITSLSLLVERGISCFHLDVLGPEDHTPDYAQACRDKAAELGVTDRLTFRGTVAVRDLLAEFDVLVLPSYNEGQPIVVLEAMAAGIPVVGTEVGGMSQLVTDPLTTPAGHTWDPCGLLLEPANTVAMADALQVMMRDRAMYEQFASNARGRVVDFFQLSDTLRAYNTLYREVGRMPPAPDGDERWERAELEPVEPVRGAPLVMDITDPAPTSSDRT